MGKKRRSNTWNFFTLENNDYALCKLCKAQLSYKGSITNLKRHITRKHSRASSPITQESCSTGEANVLIETNITDELTPFLFIDPNLNPPSSTSNTVYTVIPSTTNSENYSEETPHKVRKISKCRPEKPRRQKSKTVISEKTQIDDAILKMIAWDYQSFSMIEERGFTNLMSIVAPNYQIPSRKYFSKTLLPAKFEEQSNALRQTLSDEADSICLTTHSWSSAANDSFFDITGHYINEFYQMKTVLLDCSEFKDFHSADNLAAHIRSVTNNWNISDKISNVISDNASNITNAVTQKLKWKIYGCYAHKLNLVIQNAIVPAEDIIEKVKAIVSYFKTSDIATQQLLKYQIQNEIQQPKKLLLDSLVRWDLTFLMLQRFIQLECAIKHVLSLSDTNITLLLPSEWETCKDLCVIMEPCAEVTSEMCSEQYLNASKVIPITRGLKSSIHKLTKKITSAVVKTIASNILNGIELRFPNLEKIKALALSTFLDPRFKQYMFEEESSIESTRQNAVELITGRINQKKALSANSEEEMNDESTIESEKNKISVWDQYYETLKKAKPRGSSTSEAIQEVQRYMDESPIHRREQVTPFDWWKEHEHYYPNLAYFFKTKCNMVVTSVPCGQMFSKNENILSQRRTLLNTKKVEQITFLNVNME